MTGRWRAGLPVRASDVSFWALDFVQDQLATGPKLRVLAIVDTFSRFSSALDVRFKDNIQAAQRLMSARRSEPRMGLNISIDRLGCLEEFET